MVAIRIKTPSRSAAIDITAEVAAELAGAGIRNGICLVYTPHTTAGLTINEGADPDVMDDVLNTLDKLVPWRANYRHAEGNSAAHIKSILVGGSVQVIVNEGRLVLGTWEHIFLCEFDGPRTRQVFIAFQADDAPSTEGP